MQPLRRLVQTQSSAVASLCRLRSPLIPDHEQLASLDFPAQTAHPAGLRETTRCAEIQPLLQKLTVGYSRRVCFTDKLLPLTRRSRYITFSMNLRTNCAQSCRSLNSGFLLRKNLLIFFMQVDEFLEFLLTNITFSTLQIGICLLYFSIGIRIRVLQHSVANSTTAPSHPTGGVHHNIFPGSAADNNSTEHRQHWFMHYLSHCYSTVWDRL